MTQEKTWTLGALLDWTAKHLAQKGVESPRLDAEVLLAHAAGCRRIDLYGTRFAEEADPQVRLAYRDLIRKRLEGCPVAYLVGKKEFYGLEFKVGPGVLIPRPDSEHVVVECLAALKGVAQPRILDLGVGSGNLALTLAKHLPDAEVVGVDRSPEALAIARENAQRLGVEERVRLLEGDLFAPLEKAAAFDAIVSNPPYIAREDLPDLPVGVRDFEPRLALDGGPGGFEVLERLVAAAPNFLRPGGWLILEIGTAQEQRGRDLLIAANVFEVHPTVKDHAGHPRVLKARHKITS